MIAYNFIVIKGCIHTPFMIFQLRTERFQVCCAALRGFIRAAHKVGVYRIIEKIHPDEREMLELLYDEFKDKL